MPDGDPVVPPVLDNAAFAAMRTKAEAATAAADAAKAELATLQGKLTAMERSKLDETERVKAELADAQKQAAELAPVRDELGKFSSKFEQLYNNEIASVPADKQEALKKLSASGNWADRYDALLTARQLIVPSAPPPLAGGTVTQPGSGAPPTGEGPPAPGPLKPEQLSSLGWGTAVKAMGTPQGALPDIDSLVKSAVEKALATRT